MSGERVLSERDNGSSVRLTRGDAFSVRLAENATTGYQWTVGSALPPCLQQTAETHDPAASDAAGAGGVATFAFLATDGGNGTLVLERRRAWDAAPLETFSVELR